MAIGIEGLLDGITASLIVFSSVIFGFLSLFKSIKLKAKLLSIAGLVMIFVGFLWLGPTIDFFLKLIDENGILQHSRLSYPDQVTGYSLDDNARALIVATLYYRLSGDKRFLKLVRTFLRFLDKQRDQNGWFRTYLFISFGQRFLSGESRKKPGIF